MKSNRVTVDFSDIPELMDAVRSLALSKGQSQRQVFTDALSLYFSLHQESLFIQDVAEKAFREWDNDINSAYDSL